MPRINNVFWKIPKGQVVYFVGNKSLPSLEDWRGQVVWILYHKAGGENRLGLKLDPVEKKYW